MANDQIPELSQDEIDMVHGGGLSWAEFGKFLKNITDELVELVKDVFDKDDK